jgi:LuxR family maltose regulon positive regulatory protein
MKYIRTPAACKKLKKADDLHLPVYISAPTGWGKTSLIDHFYQRRKTIRLTGISGRLDDMPSPAADGETTFLLDDITWLEDETSMEYVRTLLSSPLTQVVMCGRGRFPRWLIREAVDLEFVRILPEDLALGVEQTRALFLSMDLNLSTDLIQRITEAAGGYPIALHFYAYHLQNQEDFGDAMKARVWDDICNYISQKAYRTLPPEVLNLLLSLSEFEEFTVDMAESVTGQPDAKQIIHRCENIGSILQLQKNRTWKFLPNVGSTLTWQKEHSFSHEQLVENYLRGARYYEHSGDTVRALEFYRKAQDHENVLRLLLEASASHPGVNRLSEMRSYFFDLTKEEIEAEPMLMSGMSMLASLTLCPDEAEHWYDALASYEKDKSNPEEKRKEAHARIAWLNISLPHRYGKNLLEIIRSLCTLSRQKHVTLPPVSITGGVPSLVNGSLDFSDWTLHASYLASTIGTPLENILGRDGQGLVCVATSETCFLRAEQDTYSICEKLNRGYEVAATIGSPQMCLAASGVLVKQHLCNGQISAAKSAIRTVHSKIEEAGITQLSANFEAFRAWFALYSGDKETVRKYLNSSIDPHASFCILDRYRAMIRLRCLIAENRFAEAGDLCTFLDGYFSSYHRTIYWIQNKLLLAVILYYAGTPQWEAPLCAALEKAEKYNFIRVISMEGGAIMPLLQQLKDPPVSRSFLRKVVDETSKMALRYPDYLRYVPKVNVQLTPRETQILGLLCSGTDMQDICSMCDISYSALKKHNSSIYRKLGAANRVEAERIARQMGLVHS